MRTDIIDSAERRRLAIKAGINARYLYQCLTGIRDMGADEAVRVEAALDGKLRRWDLCRNTWHRRWPELRGRKNAPPVPHQVGVPAPASRGAP